MNRALTSFLAVKVAPQALPISLSLGERVGVRETVMASATITFRGGAGAMTVRQVKDEVIVRLRQS
jgi:hypothetical protein